MAVILDAASGVGLGYDPEVYTFSQRCPLCCEAVAF